MAATVLARVKELEKRLNMSAASKARAPEMLRVLTRVSAEFQQRTRVSFAATVATRYLDGNGTGRVLLPDGNHLVSVTTLKVDDDDNGTYELTLTAGTDYRLTPDNLPQKWAIEVDRNSTRISYWPRRRRAIEVAGVWGWSYETESTGQAVGNTTEITASGTSLTVQSTADISIGETFVVGSEQIYVADVVDKVTLTVERGVNGTTAAAHANGVAISRRVYPLDVEEAVLDRARQLHLDNRGSGNMDDSHFAAQVPSGGYARWLAVIDAYRQPVVA